MGDYAEIDIKITQWAQKNALTLSTAWAGREVRSVYVSSLAGECFQIWIDPPEDGVVAVHAAYVEGPKTPEPAQDWHATTADLERALDDAFKTVVGRMAPSERSYPKAL